MNVLQQFRRLRDHCREFPVAEVSEIINDLRLSLERVQIAARNIAQLPEDAPLPDILAASTGMLVATDTACITFGEVYKVMRELRKKAAWWHTAFAMADLRGDISNG